VMFSVLKRITGVDLLQDLAEFFQAFSGMVGGFRERARRVNELLADSQSTFLVVCGPQGEPIDEAVYFHRKLVEAKLPFGGVVVNKVQYAGIVDQPDLAATLESAIGDAAEMRTKSVIQVPYLDFDVHDLAGLMEINRYLFATGAEERAEIAASA
jgi:anion-transporting  ArsA/GET3 family ATPase